MFWSMPPALMRAHACTLAGDSARRATITGTAGRIEVPRDFFHPQGFTVWHGDRSETVDLPFEGAGYHFEAAEVHRCLREGLTESPLVPLADTLDILTVLDVVRVKVGLDYSA